ncbi:MAG: transcriptional regulator [Methanobacteriaceae archaeon]|jgi:DNA-binding HxlR family transcriptional regulator|nr:transcriptional regulator [Methanobacteriaceae archaeon]
MREENLLSLVAYVRISKYRLKVLKSIGNDIKMPRDIAKESNLRPNHVSSTLRDLKNKKLIECINEDVRKGRIYRATELGKEVYDIIERE